MSSYFFVFLFLFGWDSVEAVVDGAFSSFDGCSGFFHLLFCFLSWVVAAGFDDGVFDDASIFADAASELL